MPHISSAVFQAVGSATQIVVDYAQYQIRLGRLNDAKDALNSTCQFDVSSMSGGESASTLPTLQGFVNVINEYNELLIKFAALISKDISEIDQKLIAFEQLDESFGRG